MSKSWCACLMTDTRRPRFTSRGISCSMSVVFPLPEYPAKPNTFIAPFRSDVKIMVCMLDDGYAQAALHKPWDQLLDERGLPAARIPGKTEYLHRAFPIGCQNHGVHA